MADILLSTLNAKFIHPAFGLRYLFANLGELQQRAVIAEFDINQRPLDIAEKLLAHHPKIIGLGVYIWNVAETTEVVSALKQVRPDLKIILGGPEVSHETESQEIVRMADHVITGEGDLKFAEVCRLLLSGKEGGPVACETMAAAVQDPRSAPPCPKIIPAELPDLSLIQLPYDYYSETDLAHRIIYVEASRGCPFTCEFCLSSLDVPVREVPMDAFLSAMQKLLDRGLKQFKFVDRTFNLNIAASRTILEFFLARHRPGNFYHFEMVPDRLPAELRKIIAQFPPGSLQFEVGIQTFNPEAGRNISRRQNYERMAENMAFLRQETGVHVHADLIVGLPGETVESFGSGFDRLIGMGPQEIQVGILKRLRGVPIVRHDAEWQVIYSAHPPYEILQNKLIDFATMQRLRRFAKYWDTIGNSGNFVQTTRMLWDGGGPAGASSGASPFTRFLRLSDWLYERICRTDSIALARMAGLLFEFLTTEAGMEKTRVARTLAGDWQRAGRRDPPEFLRGLLQAPNPAVSSPARPHLIKRQARHSAEP